MLVDLTIVIHHVDKLTQNVFNVEMIMLLAIFLPFFFFYDGFWHMWCNFKFEGVLFRSDSRHNDRVDCLPPSGPKSGAS